MKQSGGMKVDYLIGEISSVHKETGNVALYYNREQKSFYFLTSKDTKLELTSDELNQLYLSLESIANYVK